MSLTPLGESVGREQYVDQPQRSRKVRAVNLLARMSKPTLFSTYDPLTKGELRKFWYIDYEAYWLAGGDQKKSHRLKEYLKWVSWSYALLPGQREMSEQPRRTWMRKQANLEFRHFRRVSFLAPPPSGGRLGGGVHRGDRRPSLSNAWESSSAIRSSTPWMFSNTS